MNATFFPAPADFRRWLAAHHGSEKELLVGFYKKDSGKPSITWPESVDEALCFGWIDGIRRGVDAESYTIRFTPRKRGSIWSAVNMRRVEALTAEGRMLPAGLAAFANRREDRSGIYAYEQSRAAELDENALSRLRENTAAWEFFQKQAPSYRRTAAWWIASAKQEATRRKRLEKLIVESAQGRRV